jgi:hypothetical protein
VRPGPVGAGAILCRRAFCRMSRLVVLRGEAKAGTAGAGANASPKGRPVASNRPETG